MKFRSLLMVLLLLTALPAAAQDARVQEAQKILLMLGLQPDRPNGEIGAKTSRALQAFQKQQNLTPTGQLDEQTFQTLRRVRDTQIGGSFGTPGTLSAPKPQPVIIPKAPEAQPVQNVDSQSLPGVSSLPDAGRTSGYSALPPPIGGSKSINGAGAFLGGGGGGGTTSYTQSYTSPPEQSDGPTWHNEMPIWLWVAMPLSVLIMAWRVWVYLKAPVSRVPIFDEDDEHARLPRREPTL